jgi:hypothetical protein
MTPALDERTAPDAASGAVLFHPSSTTGAPGALPPLRARDFWRAVAATVLATLRPWPR